MGHTNKRHTGQLKKYKIQTVLPSLKKVGPGLKK